MDAVPRIALVMGDAAGVGIELAARLLAQEAELAEAAVLVVGDRGAARPRRRGSGRRARGAGGARGGGGALRAGGS